MIIHVVQPGDTINSIADEYGVSVRSLIQDNELTNPNNLVIGQTIVVVYPEKTYIVQEGDSLVSIAMDQGVSVMQLLRNNPHLIEWEKVIPGETLVISYNINGKIATSGYALAFINRTVLRKTLPFLTYLSIFNYKASPRGDIDTSYDDTEVIQMAKEYGTAPLMLLTTLSAHGEENIETAYDILLSIEFQERLAQNILHVLKTKGYYGVNVSLQYLNATNQKYYDNFLGRISYYLGKEGYPLFLTIDPKISYSEDKITFGQVDFSNIGQMSKEISFMNYVWGTKMEPPSPVSSILNMKLFVKYVTGMISSGKILVGLPLVGYDWELPYVAGFSSANSLTLASSLTLAGDVNTVIKFDEISKTPFFGYTINKYGMDIQHIVWFIDARTINELVKLVSNENLQGAGVWNIMEFFAQLWLIINSTYEIEKIYPESNLISEKIEIDNESLR